jgi:DNA invertase Pin-like site-specific DNA recombinase
VSVHIVKNNLNFTPNSDDKFDKFQLHVLGAVAELERGIISENQAEGIKLAKKRKVNTREDRLRLQKKN